MNIFLTGGAGFLGRAIMRNFRDTGVNARFTVFSRDEAKHAQVRREFPNARYVLGSVEDFNQVELAMAGHDVVIHAAAMKYVPEGETNVGACINVNLDGSRNVAIAAIRNQVERVVGISTDKACEPANVYGMTKRLMERIFQEMAGESDTAFVTVRYGNVIGSTGSVIPMFRRQAREGVITLTNPDMTRFWLTIENAVELVRAALALMTGYTPPNGGIIIPQLSSATMLDLVDAIEEIEGVGDNCLVKEIGQRPGEKVHEMLLSESEGVNAEKVNGHFIIHPNWQPFEGEPVPAYSSDSPVAFLSIADLVAMIQSAPEY